jgi:hypothetical protein
MLPAFYIRAVPVNILGPREGTFNVGYSPIDTI